MFLQPCFINKYSEDICKELEALGYTKSERPNFPIKGEKAILCFSDKYFVFSTGIEHVTCAKGALDCGTNKKLFFAIAALRDDIDSHQYFIFTKDVRIGPALHKEGDLFYSDNIKKVPLYHLRKATVQDILKLFNHINLSCPVV